MQLHICHQMPLLSPQKKFTTIEDYLFSCVILFPAQLTDKELLKQFKQVEQMNPEDKNLIKTFIDAFLTKRQVQQLAQ